jgi:hypothetical protein
MRTVQEERQVIVRSASGVCWDEESGAGSECADPCAIVELTGWPDGVVPDAIDPSPEGDYRMSDVMTMDEINDSFDSEWVLVGEPEYNKQMELIRGKVLFHSKDKQEVYRKDKELHPRSAAYVYTGPTPDNVLINL